MSPNYTISSCELDCSPVKTTELTKCRTVLALLALLCTLGTHGQAPTPDPFVTTWVTEAANETITIPTNPEDTYNYTVKWEDGGTEETFTGDATHTYVTAGTHMVSISGIFPRIYFNDETDTDENADKIRTIENWGDIAWASMNGAFAGCSNLRYMATDVPNLSGVTDMANMFAGASLFNGDISGWDVSKVTNMSAMFVAASAFNGNISNWNVSKVTNMSAMFSFATAFKRDISNWSVSKVTNMFAMFAGVSAFSGDLNGWNVSKVSNMASMFFDASAFNGDISGWDVSLVNNMSSMFSGATAFNGDISGWDVSKVTTMSSMFSGATAFNGDISGWDVSLVADMSFMFFNVTAFDRNLGNWDVSDVTKFNNFLSGAELSPGNYDALLVGWNNLALTAGLTFHAGSSRYTPLGATARKAIIDDEMWVITDGNQVDMAFTFAENGTDMVIDIDGSITSSRYDLAAPADGNSNDDDNASFRIDATGAFFFKDLPNFESPQDANQNNIYVAEVTITVSVKISVSVSVINVIGEPPVVAIEISNQSLAKSFGTHVIELSGTFTDDDGDDLMLAVSSANEGVVTATIAPGTTTLTLTEVGGGSSEVTVTANDGVFTVPDMFTVKVDRPPVVDTKISDLSLMVGGTEEIDLSGTFMNDDTDALTFTVSSADESVVTATIAPGTTTLTLTGTGPGSSGITVTVEDRGGLMASDTFIVTVKMVTGVAETRSLRAYPNPGSESLTIEMEGTWSLVRIYDFTGRHIHVPVREQGPSKVVLDISGLPGGIYLVKVSGGGGSTVRRLVVERRQERF